MGWVVAVLLAVFSAVPVRADVDVSPALRRITAEGIWSASAVQEFAVQFPAVRRALWKEIQGTTPALRGLFVEDRRPGQGQAAVSVFSLNLWNRAILVFAQRMQNDPRALVPSAAVKGDFEGLHGAYVRHLAALHVVLEMAKRTYLLDSSPEMLIQKDDRKRFFGYYGGLHQSAQRMMVVLAALRKPFGVAEGWEEQYGDLYHFGINLAEKAATENLPTDLTQYLSPLKELHAMVPPIAGTGGVPVAPPSVEEGPRIYDPRAPSPEPVVPPAPGPGPGTGQPPGPGRGGETPTIKRRHFED